MLHTIMNYNIATHATCPLALMAYKYNELQLSFTIQKLSCKVSCKTPFFLIVYVIIESIKFGALAQNFQCGQCVDSYENMTNHFQAHMHFKHITCLWNDP
jgi:hypothetical protein